MPAFKTIKKLTKNSLSVGAEKSALDKLVGPRKPHLFRFKDDGLISNYPTFPLIVYRGVVGLSEASDPAAVFEELFEKNGWGTPGAMASTTTFITIRRYTKCSASPEAAARFSSVVTRPDAYPQSR